MAVLSYDFWTRRFGGDPDVLGRWVTIRDTPLQIVGVAEKGFTGVEPGIMTDIWAPTMMWDDRAIADPGTRWFRIWGRMQPGVAPEQARAVLQTVFTSFRREQAAGRPAESPRADRAVPQHPCLSAIGGDRSSGLREDFARALWVLAAVAASGAAHRLRERREPAGGARDVARSARWRCGRRLAPGAAA